jgi:hypothetical protein
MILIHVTVEVNVMSKFQFGQDTHEIFMIPRLTIILAGYIARDLRYEILKHQLLPKTLGPAPLLY